MNDVTINNHFVFIGEALSKLKNIGHDNALVLTGIPEQLLMFLSVGDLIDFPELERFMFVVVSRRFSFRTNGVEVTYLIDLASHDSSAPYLKVIK